MASQSKGKAKVTDVESNLNGNIHIIIKTLSRHEYPLIVDKRIPVSELKEIIASKTDISPERQRLLFRGSVLRNDQLLSHYYVEHGHTLYLSFQYPPPPPPSYLTNEDPGNMETTSSPITSLHSGQTDTNPSLNSNTKGGDDLSS